MTRVSRTPRRRPSVLVAVGAGGAAGTLARVAILDAWTQRVGAFPWATLVVNITGSFLLGLVLAAGVDRLRPSRWVIPLVATGVCGAYTTLSTVATELVLLLRAGRIGVAAIYLAATAAGGLGAVIVGSGLGRRLPLAAFEHRRTHLDGGGAPPDRPRLVGHVFPPAVHRTQQPIEAEDRPWS